MNPVLSMLLGLSLSGTLLALLLMLLRRLAGSRLPSAFYYYAWLLVLLRFVLPLPGLMPGFAERAAAPAPLPEAFYETQSAEIRSYRNDFAHNGAAAEDELLPSMFTTAQAGRAASVPNFERYSLAAQRLFDLGQALRSARFWLSVWGIGMVGFAVWYLGGYLRFRRELRATLRPALPSDRAVYELVTDEPCPRLYRSRAVHTPMLLGVLHPMIILPDKSYSDTMLQGILAHELTHHRRGDVVFKWLSVLVSIVHWFNPVTRLFRSELDRSCELACDEKLLRHMDAGEKQLYGDMLLTLAADRRLPRSVVATSFAVEKRNLKERLVQIMTYKNRGRAGICLVLAAMFLLSACGAAVGPGALKQSQTLAVADAVPTAMPRENAEPIPSPENPGNYREVTADNVDAFLEAIGSDTILFLKPGLYDLSRAKTYGQAMPDGPYTWTETYDGYELVIRDVSNFCLAGMPGEAGEEIVISAVPRYAQVLHFVNCRNLTLSAFTAGHTVEPGQCAGGVLYFDSCVDTHITSCNLYGCGILGIQAFNCDTLRADSCAIYDCSNGAVTATGSRDIRLVECEVYDCGTKNGYATSLFDVQTSTGFAVINSNIYENKAVYLTRSTSSDEVYLLGTIVGGNSFDALFSANIGAPVVGGCTLGGNEIRGEANGGLDYAYSPEGQKLSLSDLEHMTLDRFAYEYDGPVVKQTASVTGIPGQDGMEYHVTNVDEFLAAIGSDTTIYLDAPLFDLSTASNYGGYGGEHYYWVDIYDGPGLVITGVQNLRIIGQGKDETTVEAVPRYADVLCFENCKHVSVASFTAGHTKGEPGSCTGDVLAFETCEDVHVIDCGLFGCGVWGIRANGSVMGEVLRTEIYECSEGAATIYRSDGFVFTDCSVHDCYSPWREVEVNIISMDLSGDCSYNGTPLRNGRNTVGDGVAVTNTAGSLPSLPEPGDRANDRIHLYFFETEITADKGGFTMHVGEEPIPLTAQIWHDGAWYLGEMEWSVSDPNALGLETSENGLQCEVTPLAPTGKGGAILTITSPEAGQTLEIPVYVLK